MSRAFSYTPESIYITPAIRTPQRWLIQHNRTFSAIVYQMSLYEPILCLLRRAEFPLLEDTGLFPCSIWKVDFRLNSRRMLPMISRRLKARISTSLPPRPLRSSLGKMSVVTGTSCSGSAVILIGNSHGTASGLHGEGYHVIPLILNV